MKLIKIYFIFTVFFLIQGYTFVVEPSNNAVDHNQRGVTYLTEGHYFAAMQEFKIAILLSPDSAATASFYNNLGLVYGKISRFDWAIDCFQRAINLNPNFIEYYNNLIKCYKFKKNLKYMYGKYKTTLIRDKSNSRTYLILGLIAKELGRDEDALSYFEKFKELEPDLIITKSIENYIENLR